MNTPPLPPVEGAQVGIGYRRDFGNAFFDHPTLKPDFLELAPENWMDIGGYWKTILDRLAQDYRFITHGLSLSIGSPDPINWDFVRRVKQFLDTYNIQLYSEHLSFSHLGNAHMYDLLPIPFREDAVRHIAERIQQIQDFLERPLAIENVSYYTPVAAEMSETQFLRSILEEADCRMLLDVNNIYVNAFNHHYDARQFIDALPLERVAYIHMAGHYKISEELIIDTHGAPIIDPVFELFEYAAERLHPVPVLLERDFNIPELSELGEEIDELRRRANVHWLPKRATA